MSVSLNHRQYWAQNAASKLWGAQPKISLLTELLWWVLPSSTHKTPNRYHTDIGAIILANLHPYFSPTLLQYFSANTPMDFIAQTKTKFAQILTALTVILEWSIPIMGRSFMMNSPNGNNQNVWTVWTFKNGGTRQKWGVERTSKSKVLLDLFKLILVGSFLAIGCWKLFWRLNDAQPDNHTGVF